MFIIEARSESTKEEKRSKRVGEETEKEAQQFLLENWIQSKEIFQKIILKKWFPFLYLIHSFFTQNSKLTLALNMQHIANYLYFKDTKDLERLTKTQSFIQFHITNINWMTFMNKVCLRWKKRWVRKNFQTVRN